MNSKHGSQQKLQMLQRQCYRASRHWWTVGRKYAEPQMELTVKFSQLTTFLLVCKINCFDWWIKHCTQHPHLFSFLSYRYLKSQ
jgi:hypothetical protein